MDHMILPPWTMRFHVILCSSQQYSNRGTMQLRLPFFFSLTSLSLTAAFSSVSLTLPLGYHHLFTNPCELQKGYLGCTIPKFMTWPSTSLHMLASLEKHTSLFGKHWPKILLSTTVFYCELKGSYSRCQNQQDPCVSGPVY